MIKPKKQLRFAPIIRVSTEKQKEKGESLRTQKKQVIESIELLNGVIPDHCWGYSGQEHATPEFERKKLDQLLKDSEKDLFDAVIVIDPSRWSRDNAKNKKGLSILKKNGIRFFVGTMEYNLYDPHHSFILGMSSEINELQAKSQSQKSLLNRINRAKRGIPTGGKLPWGRTFDKETLKWGIDKKKQRLIKTIANEYLTTGKSELMAKKYEMSYSHILKVLKHRCGTKWELKFKKKEFNIDVTISLEIPRLLPDKTIKAIHRKSKANKTFLHGHSKNKYLLSRMIFCKGCNYALYGQANRLGKMYYRHSRGRGCQEFNSIPTDIIDNAILIHIFSMLGDKAKIEKAAKDAIPNLKEVIELQERRVQNELELSRIDKAKEKLLDQVELGTLSNEVIKKRMDKYFEREKLLSKDIKNIDSLLENIPTQEEITKKSLLLQATKESLYYNYEHLKEMTFEDKKHLLQLVFNGTDKDGRRFGVYIKKTNNEKFPWKYEIIGNLVDEIGHLPMSKEMQQALLGILGDASKDYDPFIKQEKQNKFSKRDAHNRICVHQ